MSFFNTSNKVNNVSIQTNDQISANSETAFICLLCIIFDRALRDDDDKSLIWTCKFVFDSFELFLDPMGPN